mmetsp:Transcript_23262/g.78156  ORF Transcript_23262/g.78156 Transcript_23262/m.78156 type:complete len:417 (-) Transcript_23262:9-1259(-)
MQSYNVGSTRHVRPRPDGSRLVGWPVLVRRPLQLGRVHGRGVVLFVHVEVEHVLAHVDGVLAAKVLEEVEGLERGDDVLRAEGGHVGELLDGHHALVLGQDLQELARPVGPVAHETQVREGPLRGAELPLALGELVGDGNHELAKALALVAGEREDAGQVVVLRGDALLGEVAHHVGPGLVAVADDVEEKGLDVVVERLVVQEELGQQAQVLAVDALHARVHLVHGHVRVPVDLVPRRVEEAAPGPHVSLQLGPARKVAEVVLAEVERVAARVLLGEGREVPGLHLELADCDAGDVLDLGRLLVLLERGRVELPLLLGVVGLVELLARVARQLLAVARGLVRPQVKAVHGHPLVHAPVEAEIMHVVLPLHGLDVLPAVDNLAHPVLVIAPSAEELASRLQGFVLCAGRRRPHRARA